MTSMIMRKSFATLAFIFLISLFGCKDQLNIKYQEATKKEDFAKIKQELSAEDIAIIQGNLVRLQVKGKDIEGMTYREILEDGRVWQAKYKEEHMQ